MLKDVYTQVAAGTLQNVCDEDEWEFARGEFLSALDRTLFADRNLWHIDDEGQFIVEKFPLWHGTVDGTVCAFVPEDLLEGITVRSDWRLNWEIVQPNEGDDYLLIATLYHHDAPTGGTMTVYKDRSVDWGDR